MNRRRFRFVPIAVENFVRELLYVVLAMTLERRWRPERIVVLGHMRSGSTLLSAILNHNPHVAGIGELHLTYRTPRRMRAMEGKVTWKLGTRRPEARYVFDKLLHDYLLDPRVAAAVLAAAHVIFLIREPESTMQSLIGTFGFDLEEASQYYVNRLQTLDTLARALCDRTCIALVYDTLVDHQAESLAAVTGFLGLATPLATRYEPDQRLTGDPSPNLRSGRILTSAERARHEVTIPAAQLEPMCDAFERSVRTFTELGWLVPVHADHVIPRAGESSARS